MNVIGPAAPAFGAVRLQPEAHPQEARAPPRPGAVAPRPRRAKEGKYALKWTRLSCRRFRDNQARLQLFALAYNLANFLRQLALPRPVRTWTLTTLREKLIKIGAKVVRHAKAVTFQMAEVAVPRALFVAILGRISRLRAAPSPG